MRKGETPSGLLGFLAGLTGVPKKTPSAADYADALFRAFADSTAAAVLVHQDGRIRYANPGARALTGRSQEDLLAADYWTLFHPDQRDALRQREQPRSPGAAITRHELKMPGPNGEQRWVDLTSAAVELGGESARLVVGFDVTDRKLAESAHREAERRLRDFLERMQLVAVVRDAQGEVTFANECFLELVGAVEEQVVARDWFEWFVPPESRDAQRAAFLEHLASDVPPPYEESEILARLDERRVISWNHTLLHDLQGRVIGAASIGTDVTERRRAEQQLIHDAFHDFLTGLPNRALFMDRLGGALARARRRPGRLLAVLCLDVDRFKLVNDSLGHGVGDQLLVQVSRVLAACVSPGDTVARLGGDEFALLLDDLDDPADAVRVGERALEALAAPFHAGGGEVFLTASIGIATSCREYALPEDLLRDADTALYQAKAQGRARHRVFDTSMHSQAVRVLALENELRRAVERKAFILHYQPIVEIATGRITGLEALVRWEDSERGLIPPAEFVGLAEETGLIGEIGEWALRESCRAARGWVDELGADVSVAVNLSGKQFSDPGLVERIAGLLRETGLEPGRLKLEITESALMESADSAIAMLERLRELGVRICIDDFGTGYSSLSYLLRLPADTLKVDRSFVSAVTKGGRNAQIVGTIVSLGHGLGMEVIAEGVESAEQKDALVSLGCRQAQGFFFSRPVDRERVGQLLSTARSGA